MLLLKRALFVQVSAAVVHSSSVRLVGHQQLAVDFSLARQL